MLKAKLAVWEDGKTRFEIIEITTEDRTRASSVMIDDIGAQKR